jgi:putative ABC transport system substrate-binding protein
MVSTMASGYAHRVLLLGTMLLVLVMSAPEAYAAKRLVGVIFTADLPRYRETHRALVKTLAQKGYDSGTVEIIEQYPNTDPISLANTIRKFVGLNADLIVAYGAPAALAGFKEGGGIPLVFADVYGPVEMGITTSMTRSGTNLTGVSSKVPLITLLKTVQEILPVQHVGVIYSSREAGSLIQLKEVRRVAAQLGVSVEEFNVITAAGFDTGLATLVQKVDCVLVSESTVAMRNFDKIVRKATDAKVPVLSMIPDSAGRGALLALEVSSQEQGQLAAEQAVRLLGGVKAGSVPIASPKRVDFIVNLKSARNLDVQVPFSVLSNATKIIK